MMRLSSTLLTGALIGVLLTAPLLALLYLGDQAAGLPFVPFDVFDWMARTLPGDVITRGVDTMVDLIDRLDLGETSSTAKRIETLSAWAMFFGGGVAGAVAFFVLRSRIAARRDGWIGVVPGLGWGLLLAVPLVLISQDVNVTATTSDPVSILWLVMVMAVWGLALDWTYGALAAYTETTTTPEPERADASAGPPVSATRLSRRQFLVRVGATSATLTVVGSGIARYLEYRDERDLERLIERRRAAVLPQDLPNEDAPVTPASGTRPEYTPLEDHYRIDISVRPPEIAEADWRLRISGLVDTPVELTLDELRDGYDPVNQYVTLACISNPVAGDLTSTTRWTGVRLRDVLADVGLQPEAQFLKISSADGFDETLDLLLLEDEPRIMLAYAWDGIPLLPKHGFPLRIYIPDRFGMKQPKWITDIEAIPEFAQGYWVRRGWDPVARMRATSVIDVVASDETYTDEDGTMRVPIGGIAHAGARGISKVEVRVDDGDWVEAQLRAPLSETTWVIWRYDWPFEEGRHSFEVRCFEGDGTEQVTERSNPHPDGATGLHSVTRSA